MRRQISSSAAPNLQAKIRYGETPLHRAARSNAREVVSEFIERGADVHARNDIGWTPLHVATWSNAREVTAEFIKGGADAHARDKVGGTPLHWGERRALLAHVSRRLAFDDLPGATPQRSPHVFY